jgi:serine/arginine repetitive matrix protein 2
MSYNGVGLQSVRGSGTSGYVQRNLSVPKPQRRYDLMRDSAPQPEVQYKKPNSDIMQHAAKRAVELKLMDLRLLMEEQGYGESEIFDKLAEARANLAEVDDLSAPSATGSISATGTHGLSALKQAEEKRLRGAFGISLDYKEGAAFDVEAQAQRKADAHVARQAANAKWEAEVTGRSNAARSARDALRTARESEPRISLRPASHTLETSGRRRDWSRSRSPRKAVGSQGRRSSRRLSPSRSKSPR